MAEWKHLITDWLNEYASLQENEIKSFAAEHEHNHEVATAVFNLLYNEDETQTLSNSENDSAYEQVTNPICFSGQSNNS